MLPASNPDLHPLIRKLESIAPVSDDERAAIAALPITVRELKADADIVRDQDQPSQCCAILEGFACRYKVLPGGKRQIMSFHIPGDIPDLQSLHLEVMDHSLATIVASKVAFIPHDAVRFFLRAHPRIADVFWRDTLIDAAMFRERVVNVGRRDAYAAGSFNGEHRGHRSPVRFESQFLDPERTRMASEAFDLALESLGDMGD